MGLDWIVGARPRDEVGYSVLAELLAKPEDATLRSRWREIPKIDSWTVLNAPCVGSSAEADAWFVKHRLAGCSDTEIRTYLERNKGYSVVRLVACDGVPVYSNADLNRELEFTSFRGQFLKDAVGVIDEEMFERAHENMLPPQFLAFGRELEAAATCFAREQGVMEIAARRDPPEDGDSPGAVAHILASAARWCQFWATRGHWLNTWW